MYTAVLMVAVTAGTATVECRPRCYSGCSGYYGGCYGGYGGCYGGSYGGYSRGYYAGSGYGGYYGANYGPGMYYYSSGSPSYLPYAMMPTQTTTVRQSFYSAPTGVVVNVLLPNPDAQVWFNNVATNQRGTSRTFESPPLETGANYTYTIKASWMSNGQRIERERRVQVQPGQSITVDFNMNPGEKLSPPKT